MLDSTLPNTAHPGASPRTKAFASLMHSSIGWSCVSDVTGRRFGKTISVSMFAAAMIYATPNVECSIYSTCKRISQKLLRNVVKFLNLIYTGLNVPKYRIIRENMEELVVHGPESAQDVRIVNSYPSKVAEAWGVLAHASSLLRRACAPGRVAWIAAGGGSALTTPA